MKDHFVKKYMRLAKQVGEDGNNCHSRKIGVVIVRVHEDGSSKILGTGYNSPPRSTPHCDSEEYLREIFWKQLTDDEKNLIVQKLDYNVFHFTGSGMDDAVCEKLCEKYANQKICPRKLIDAQSGQRLELCSCVHAETNAIVNSCDDLYGAYMFCWCGVPCVDCTKLIINSGIKRLYVIDWGFDYSHSSRWLFGKKGVEIYENAPDYYLS